MAGFNLLLALFLVFLNGFFVAAEFALVKVRSTQLAETVQKGSNAAKLALYATKHLDAYLSATQLGITLASIGLGWVGEPAVAVLIEPLLAQTGASESTIKGISFGVAFTLISLFHIVLGELAPKSWAIQRPESLILLVIRPLHWFYVIFSPVIRGMNWLASLILRPFGIHTAGGHESAHSEDELRMLVVASGQSGVLNETEVEIAGHVLGFADKKVEDVMIPRVEVVALDATKPLAEVLEFARSKPFSRYPVVNGDQDDVIGVIHIKELFGLAVGEPGDLRSISREAMSVPVNKALDKMLRDFQRERNHMAIVLDEYGGMAGLITLEDVIEEIVGDIADEHDPEGGKLDQIGPKEWLAAGSVRIDKANEVLGSQLSSEEHDTLNGWLFERLGRVPKVGETLSDEGTVLTVEEADGRRAVKVRIQLL